MNKTLVAPTQVRTLSAIAQEIKTDLQKLASEQKKPVNWRQKYYAAVPYIDAISCMNSMDDTYGVETGKDIVPYLLSNLNTWRGDKAKAIKAELKAMAGIK